MKLRIALTVIMLFLYSVGFNIYIHELLTTSYHFSVLLYNYLTFGMLLFCVADWKAGFVSYLHKQFNLIGFSSLMSNYLLIILTHHNIIMEPVYMFFIFNGGIVLATVMIFVSMVRHKVYD